jgi:hypothetical protein
MRCSDVHETWAGLHDWLDQAGVFVLPPLRGVQAGVRLDADLTGRGHPETSRDRPEDLAVALDRVRALVTRFAVQAVYVGRGDHSVTLRFVVDGIIHELTLQATGAAAHPEEVGYPR